MNKEAMEPNADHVVNSVNLNNESKSDEAFNPSHLGREFVRQYYTMLNEGPQNLFRFYSDNSSLIHGNAPGEAVQAAFGQYDINRKLMSLNFKDCHTKIRQVDSLETTNKSVVIQVMGELSNNGQPMRRFFQTFILSPRSPTHYYVRNDIFRYQDEVFIDDDEGYTEENVDDSSHVNSNAAIDTSQATVLSSSLVLKNNLGNLPNKNDKLNGQLSDDEKANSSDLQDRKKFSCMDPEISPINTLNTESTDLEPQLNQLNRSGSEQSINSSTLNNNNDKQVNVNDDGVQSEKIDSDQSASSSVLVQPQEEKQQQPVQETRTYATMVQRKFGQLGSSSSSVIINSIDKKDGQLIKSNEECLVNTVLNNNKKDEFPLASDWNFESNHTEPTMASAVTSTVASNDNNHHDSKPQRNGGGGQLSDEHQIFVGNLPSAIDEERLREYFHEYGHIVDVRICQKQGKTPNYGFITFNESYVVKKLLSKKPIFFDGHRINVEEKKSSSGRPFNSNSSAGSFNRNKDKDKEHLNNRNFNSNSTGSNNQFSAFSGNVRSKEDRNRGFKDKERKSANSNNSGNRNVNSNFRRS